MSAGRDTGRCPPQDSRGRLRSPFGPSSVVVCGAWNAPYVEYSALLKTESSFNDSHLLVTGAAWKSSGWYIYSEVAYSNGNDFVGNEAGYGAPNTLPYFTSNRLGANPTNQWEYRFNINLGYYF